MKPAVRVPHRSEAERKQRNIQEGRRVGESVQGEAASLGATPDTFGRVPFAAMDILRRALGNALGAFGLDPDECPTA